MKMINRLDPGVCSAVASEDAKILREREIDELRLLLVACLEWESAIAATVNPVLSTADKILLNAILQARKQI